MPSGEPRVSVPVLRDAVREAAHTSSSRAVARDVGLSAPALNQFIAGSEPRISTVRKLTTWYVRYRQERGDATLDEKTAAAALDFLVEHIPTRRRNEVRDALLDCLERAGDGVGVEAPPWLKGIRAAE